MYSFLLCLAALVLGYFLYGRFIERVFAPDDRATPVMQHEDGVDYIKMSRGKMFMIQFLNIAGVGPIFGAIMGAKFGVSSFLWITLGSIFAGAVHDYLSAMLSLRHGGLSLPEIVGHYMGRKTGHFMREFSIVLLVLVGAVFVASPAGLLTELTGGTVGMYVWIVIIFLYYMVAAVLPINKIIGRIYPLFAVALLFMAGGVLVAYFFQPAVASMPELWQGLGSTHPDGPSTPLFPILFVSIACGAISGFHATQSPMMCRCMTSERQGRPVFYGAMIVEGIVALIWAAAAIFYFRTVPDGLQVGNPSTVVFSITRDWLGVVGGVLAVLGVVAAPISTGDTALRSARLIVTDILTRRKGTHKVGRLPVCVFVFGATLAVLFYSLADKDGFNVIWRYFAWANQTMAVFTLWTVTVYLTLKRKAYWLTLLPALFMTMVCSTYLCVAHECIGMPQLPSYIVGALTTLFSLLLFLRWKSRTKVWGDPEH